METKIEYRVRPVVRFIVTRCWREDDGPRQGGGSSQHGEFDNVQTAYEVGYSLCRAEHDRLGWPPGDERIIYPEATAERLSPAQLYQKMADSLRADEARERLRREQPELLAKRPT